MQVYRVASVELCYGCIVWFGFTPECVERVLMNVQCISTLVWADECLRNWPFFSEYSTHVSLHVIPRDSAVAMQSCYYVYVVYL